MRMNFLAGDYWVGFMVSDTGNNTQDGHRSQTTSTTLQVQNLVIGK